MKNYILTNKSIEPLITFRILFGLIMAVSIFRFHNKGWIAEQYLDPRFFFTFYGFDWVKPLPGEFMYWIFLLMFVAALGILLGLFYRASALLFFLSFTYVELLDKTNYLNHYYFVSLVAFLLLFVPANKKYSLDTILFPKIRTSKVPAWTIDIFKMQLMLVYFFAGLAKLNYDWLFEAMPMKLWLPSLTHTPIIGFLFNFEWTAFAFSWAGALYDLTIAFFLLNHKTRPMAYVAVVVFHVLTAVLFQIGMFPYIMILSTLIFFSEDFHQRLLSPLEKISSNYDGLVSSTRTPSWVVAILLIYMIAQVCIPLRHMAYPGSVFWTEQGYRFSWRVMLMEKAGYAQFQVRDAQSDKIEWVDNYDHLNAQQEKMMSTQPDMILQFAHYLEGIYRNKGFKEPQIFCTSRVTLNGRRSQVFVDPEVDLLTQKRGIWNLNWIRPQSETQEI